MEDDNTNTFDPWAPKGSIKPISMPIMKDPRRDMPSTESYIASLESKLARMKKKKCSSKDMIESLSQARQDHMEHIAPATDYTFTEEGANSSRLAQMQRRIVPQQALSSEELQVLVENDELAKLMDSISKEMEEMARLETAASLPFKNAEGENTAASLPITNTTDGAEAFAKLSVNDVHTTQDNENTSDTSKCSDTDISPKEALQDEEKDVCVKNDNEAK